MGSNLDFHRKQGYTGKVPTISLCKLQWLFLKNHSFHALPKRYFEENTEVLIRRRTNNIMGKRKKKNKQTNNDSQNTEN